MFATLSLSGLTNVDTGVERPAPTSTQAFGTTKVSIRRPKSTIHSHLSAAGRVAQLVERSLSIVPGFQMEPRRPCERSWVRFPARPLLHAEGRVVFVVCFLFCYPFSQGRQTTRPVGIAFVRIYCAAIAMFYPFGRCENLIVLYVRW